MWNMKCFVIGAKEVVAKGQKKKVWKQFQESSQ
jgi:hypothetical protein